MKRRPPRFLSYDNIDHNSEIFSYIQELHEYLWRFIRAVKPGASGTIDDHIDRAIEELDTQRTEIASAPEVKALVNAASNLLETTRRRYMATDWSIAQWIADEPTVMALDEALDLFRVPE